MAGRRASFGPSGASPQQLNTVAKLISEAQTLDANGDELGAYRHYLSCVAHMTQTLSNDIQANQGQGTLSQQQCTQLFKMARHCLERGEKIYNVAKSEQRPLALFRLASPSPTASPTQLVPPHGAPPLDRSRTWPNNVGLPTRSMVNVRAVGVGRGDESDTTPQSPGDSQPRLIQHLSYMDRARLHNRHMMEQYKAYLRETRTSNQLPSDAGLGMLRRLEENVGVAKIKEQTIARRLREREIRIQQENRRTSQAPLLTLSVDELCDLVTSYEHGKSAITTIKAKLNTAGSNHDQTYAAISEILSMTDHPLSKLLGEGQYSVYMMLQPLVTAVERAGGLPHLEIRLDNCGLDRKPSDSIELDNMASGIRSNSLGGRLSQSGGLASGPPVDETGDDDALLDLLTEDDEDILEIAGNTSLYSQQEGNQTSTAAKEGPEPLYHRLESLPGHNERLYHVLEPGSETSTATENGAVESDQTFSLTSNVAYCTVKSLVKAEEEPRYVSYSIMMGGSSGEVVYGNSDQDESGNFYSVPPPRANEDDIPSDDQQEGETPYPQEGKSPTSRIYETLDNLQEQRHLYETLDALEVTDGGLLSRPEPETVFNNLPPLVCAAHFGDESSLYKLADTAGSVIKEATKIIQKTLTTLEEVFVKCYPVLSADDYREVCSTVLEAAYFPPILQPLTLVYRCKNYKEECVTASNMCQNVNATPKDLAVREKFWLIKQTYAPYGEAIDELRRLPSLAGPTPKLDGLVRMSKGIVKCIDEYYEAQGTNTVDTGVGVDDILPILSYIIIRSGLPQLVSECSVMEEFIREGYMRGEEGFCLTSFITALKFVSHMSS